MRLYKIWSTADFFNQHTERFGIRDNTLNDYQPENRWDEWLTQTRARTVFDKYATSTTTSTTHLIRQIVHPSWSCYRLGAQKAQHRKAHPSDFSTYAVSLQQVMYTIVPCACDYETAQQRVYWMVRQHQTSFAITGTCTWRSFSQIMISTRQAVA